MLANNTAQWQVTAILTYTATAACGACRTAHQACIGATRRSTATGLGTPNVKVSVLSCHGREFKFVSHLTYLVAISTHCDFHKIFVDVSALRAS